MSRNAEPVAPRIWWSPTQGVITDGQGSGPELPADAVPYRPADIRAGLELGHAAGASWPMAKPPRVWWSAERGGLIVGNPDMDPADYGSIPADAVPYGFNPKPDPDLIRWCEYPDCLASFHAISGPAENGWLYRKGRGVGGALLLCPAHRDDSHLISSEGFTRDDPTVTVVCDCGDRAVIKPTTGWAMRQWWAAHVRTVDRP